MRHIITFFILVTYLSSIASPLYSMIQPNDNSVEQYHYIKESFSNGHSVRIIYNSDEQPVRIQISDIAEILYEYKNKKLSRVHRLNNSGQVLYTHRYLLKGREAMIGGLGFIERSIDDLIYTCKTPYSLEVCKYDESGNIIERIINGEIIPYQYDKQDRLLCETNSLQDRLETYDEMPCIYDEQGNLIQKKHTQYVYDKQNRLIEVITENSVVSFVYDYRNRRISKRVQSAVENYEQTYLYYENIPIAIFKNGILEQLAIPGGNRFDAIAQAVAIETSDGIYAPIYDIQWNISKLIDINTKQVYTFSTNPFGGNLDQEIPITPWLFATKEYDPETNLIYFGHRYYDPTIQRWLSKDPLLQKEDNLYTYCFNNPLRYIDPDGRFTIVIPLIDLTLGVLGKAILKGLLLGGTAWLGATGVKKTDEYLKEKEKKKRIDENRRVEELQKQQGQKNRDAGLKPNPPFEKKSKPGNMQKQVERGQAPNSIDRVEHGHVPNERDHIHFNDGKTLNSDGKWRRNDGRNLTRQEKNWLQQNGWEIPE